jgi:hypothetical protein
MQHYFLVSEPALHYQVHSHYNHLKYDEKQVASLRKLVGYGGLEAELVGFLDLKL